jgi:hypothetical protein
MNINYIVIILLIICLTYILVREYDNINQPSQIHIIREKNNSDMVQPMSPTLLQPMFQPMPTTMSGTDIIGDRDEAVLRDNLYPPLDRMNRPLADEYLKYKLKGDFGWSTRDNSDTYRLIGYLINSTDRADKWNLFGRQKNRGSNQGE